MLLGRTVKLPRVMPADFKAEVNRCKAVLLSVDRVTNGCPDSRRLGVELPLLQSTGSEGASFALGLLSPAASYRRRPQKRKASCKVACSPSVLENRLQPLELLLLAARNLREII